MGRSPVKVVHIAALVLSIALVGPAVAAAVPAYKIVDRIKVPDGGFDYAAFDPAMGRVYMARTNFTTVVDAKTGKVSQLNSASGGHMLLAIPGTTLGLLPQGKGTIRIINIPTDAVIVDLPAGMDPDCAVYDPVSKFVFVLNKASGEATVVDPIARKVVATIQIGGILQFPASDGEGHVFATVDSVPEIAVIDVKSLKVTGRYPLKGCTGAQALAYDAEHKFLISSCVNGLAKVLEASSGKEVASLAIAQRPDATVYDPVRKLAFIPSGADGVLEVVSLADPAHISVIQHVPTQAGSRTATIDPQSGRVYLMASQPDTAAVVPPGGRGAPRLPGSYEVLVVGQ